MKVCKGFVGCQKSWADPRGRTIPSEADPRVRGTHGPHELSRNADRPSISPPRTTRGRRDLSSAACRVIVSSDGSSRLCRPNRRKRSDGVLRQRQPPLGRKTPGRPIRPSRVSRQDRLAGGEQLVLRRHVEQRPPRPRRHRQRDAREAGRIGQAGEVDCRGGDGERRVDRERWRQETVRSVSS